MIQSLHGAQVGVHAGREQGDRAGRTRVDHRARKRAGSILTSELEALREELGRAHAERAGARDAAARLQRRCAELEAQLEAQARKARRDLDDGDLRCKELTSQLKMVTSELALARQALATATDNLRALQESNEDLLMRLELRG